MYGSTRVIKELHQLKMQKYQLMAELDRVTDEALKTEEELKKEKENYNTEIKALSESKTRQELQLDELGQQVKELETKRMVRRDELRQLEEQQKIEAEDDGTEDLIRDKNKQLKKMRRTVERKKQELQQEKKRADEMEERFRDDTADRDRESEERLERTNWEHNRYVMKPLLKKTKALTDEDKALSEELRKTDIEIDLYKEKVLLLQEKNRLLAWELEERLNSC
ncbi:UNVERIFIED_CONTAM: hypothetical protein PYX00_007758 [Menopon gallinae]|uniref:Uncharacterized protein n=1 Tax=Menopon gallinae TaxID=328185 RepID=A0AAW2HLJ0_9NEOP